MTTPTSTPTSSHSLDQVAPTTREMEEEESAAGGRRSPLPDTSLFSEDPAIIETVSNYRPQQRLQETGKGFIL